MVDFDDQDDFDPDSNYFDEIITENHVFSSFNSFDDFYMNNKISLQDPNHLSIIGQNIRSFNSNLDTFMLLFDDKNMPDILVFSETWKDIYDPIIIPGYNGYHTVRQGPSGGVSVFIKSHINSEIVQNMSYADDSIEICTVKVTNESNSMYVLGIYRPVSGDIDSFSQALETILSDRILRNHKCVLIGDFNVNMFAYGTQNVTDRFIDMMRSHHYIQVISDVTRHGNNITTPSLIDLIWINQLSAFNSAIIKTGITDHYTIYIQIPFVCIKKPVEKIKITFRDCSDSYHEVFQNNLENFDWVSLRNNDVDTYTYNFISALNNIFQTSFPLRTKVVTTKYFSNPWHNSELKRLTDARVKYHNLYK